MLLPRYSLRTVLWGITCCAVFFLIVGQAWRGRGWAIVISVSLASLVVTLIFHAFCFGLISALSQLVGTQLLPARTSRGGLQAEVEPEVLLETDDVNVLDDFIVLQTGDDLENQAETSQGDG
jgi:hypothetical protein